MRAEPPVSLTIAGSDSGGGAGIAADLKSFAANDVHGTMVITIVTAQNTTGISAVGDVDPAMVAAQIDAIATGFQISSTKTGLLFAPAVAHVVADRAESLPELVVDPVLVRSNGSPFLDDQVVDIYRDALFRHAQVITPNVAEAELLTGMAIGSRENARAAAEALLGFGATHVVVTGLLVGDRAIDTHVWNGGGRALESPRIDTPNVLGTGCSFSATIAARLARGDSPASAIDRAKAYVARGIASSAAWHLGDGHGPIDHFAEAEKSGGL
ncbi:MAG: bifunctional hydroxymethylpyrimidine kinase/phosphomethylpyrimidine kinase [Acidimicrobiales bacterium]